ncbi:MAG: hypothetical protein KC432_13995 [Thermomicrobiales bacterium]|nr:hypothetical protein [Thermomicrobiales bacterium]
MPPPANRAPAAGLAARRTPPGSRRAAAEAASLAPGGLDAQRIRHEWCAAFAVRAACPPGLAPWAAVQAALLSRAAGALAGVAVQDQACPAPRQRLAQAQVVLALDGVAPGPRSRQRAPVWLAPDRNRNRAPGTVRCAAPGEARRAALPGRFASGNPGPDRAALPGRPGEECRCPAGAMISSGSA